MEPTRRRPWARAALAPANAWDWQARNEFWSTLGQAASGGEARVARPFRAWLATQLKIVSSIVRRFPSVVVLPLIICGLLVGLGVFGVRTAAEDAERSARLDAEATALKVASSFAVSLEKAILPVLSLSTFIREGPAMATLGPAFGRIAGELLSQAGAPAIQMKLVPFGIVRAIQPPRVDLVTLGLNLFTDPTRRQEALETVELRAVWLAGPLTVPPDSQHVLVARNPIFIAGVGPDETWGNGAEGNTNCSACYDAATRTKFWGFAAVYIAFDSLTAGPSSPLLQLRSRSYLYSMVKPAKGPADGAQPTVLAVSSPAPPAAAVTVSIDVPSDTWRLSVYPQGGFRPAWEGPLMAVVVVVSLALSSLLFVALLNHRRLLVLLSARLPVKALQDLRTGQPHYNFFPSCTVLTASVARYTNQAAGINPHEVVRLLNDVYAILDGVVERHGLYKVETFGDSYIAIGGCPEAGGRDDITWAAHAAHCARDMVVSAAKFRSSYGQRIQLQIGLHSGPLVAAVIDGGKRLPRYCLLGDTVALSGQLEASSQPMAIHVSRDTVELLAHSGDPMIMLVPRGVSDIRGRGFMMTSWLQVDLMAGAYGGAYGGRQSSTDLIARHRDDDEVSLDGFNMVRKTLPGRGSEDGTDRDRLEHPMLGSFARRVDSESWAVVREALGIAAGEAAEAVGTAEAAVAGSAAGEAGQGAGAEAGVAAEWQVGSSPAQHPGQLAQPHPWQPPSEQQRQPAQPQPPTPQPQQQQRGEGGGRVPQQPSPPLLPLPPHVPQAPDAHARGGGSGRGGAEGSGPGR